jgi:hypothetical protein
VAAGSVGSCSALDTDMSSLTQPFKFPKKLWLVLSLICFLYLFFSVVVNGKGDNPTAWRAILEGEVGMGMMFGVIWGGVALAFAGFVAAVFGIARQLFSRSSDRCGPST